MTASGSFIRPCIDRKAFYATAHVAKVPVRCVATYQNWAMFVTSNGLPKLTRSWIRVKP